MVEVEAAVAVELAEADGEPLSWASSSQGEMFASWSSRVTTISSPACQSRAAVARARSSASSCSRRRSTSSGAAAEQAAAAARAAATTSLG